MPVFIFEPLIEEGKEAVRLPRSGEWVGYTNDLFALQSGQMTFDHPIYTRRVLKENPMGPILEAWGMRFESTDFMEVIQKAVEIWEGKEGDE